MPENIQVKDLFFEKFISAEEISSKVQQLGADITRYYADEKPVILPVLNGSFIFAADLIRRIELDCEISFVKYSSYSQTHSTGEVKELIGLKGDFAGKKVLIIEDIVDTGRTMEKLLQTLQNAGAKEVKIAALLFKKEMLVCDINPDFVGFVIPNRFVVGYGLDYDDYGRHYDAVYAKKD
jgi:hypoxanthine phosphoribosyltransferase